MKVLKSWFLPIGGAILIFFANKYYHPRNPSGILLGFVAGSVVTYLHCRFYKDD